MCNTALRHFSFFMGLPCVLLSLSGQADTAGMQTHVVRQGETLWNIAKEHLDNSTQWRQIQKLNAVVTPRNLQVGSELTIPLRAQAFPVKVLYLQGRAWLTPKGESERPITRGMMLYPDQGVRTEDGAFMTLRFADGVLSVLPSRSRAVLSQERQRGAPQVLLQEGEVESYVPKRAVHYNTYEVTTPQGVLGVRGTHFRVRLSTATSALVEVLDGRVVTESTLNTSRKEVAIGHNQGLVFTGKDVLHVQPLLKAPENLEQALPMPGNPDWKIRTQPLPGAVAYFAQVSRTADFLMIEQDQLSQHPAFNFTGLEDGFYYVRIAAIDAQGLRGEPASFLVLHRLTNDAHAVRTTPQTTQFNWTAPPPVTGLSYHLQIADNDQFNLPLVDQHDIEGTSISINDLPPGTLYWRIESEPAHKTGHPTLSLGSGILQ